MELIKYSEITTTEEYKAYLRQQSKIWYKNNKERKKQYQREWYYNSKNKKSKEKEQD